MKKTLASLHSRYFVPYDLSLAQRLFLVPYFGLGGLRDPTRGDLVAGLGDTTAIPALERLHARMLSQETGKRILAEKPLITEQNLDVKRLRTLPESTLGRQYMRYVDEHNFSADERSVVRFIKDPELAYVMARYRQIHDFWHVFSGLPPTVLGELALKYFEWRMTGLPVCLISASIGPLKLSFAEQREYARKYIPWAESTARDCTDLMCFFYEEHLDRDVEDLRKELRFAEAPK